VAAGAQPTLGGNERSISNDYWHFDRLTSFQSGANYTDEIAGAWDRFFEALHPSAAILDLCTGNGAIAVLAVQADRRSRKGFKIAAADAADINPCLHVTSRRDELAAVDFHPATPAEELPWPDASFDAIVSQFGVEYTDIPRTLAEVARVVSPGGRVRFSLHAAEGEIVARSERAIGEIDVLLKEIDVAGKAHRCLRTAAAVERLLDRSETALSAARESADAFARALRQMGERIPSAADPQLLRDSGRNLVELYQRRREFDLARSIGLVEEMRAEWRNHQRRLVAQVRAAVSRRRRGQIANLLRQFGAKSVKDEDQVGAEGLIAHCIVASF
jgi:SAM-dependent methyltransferase